MLSKNPITAMVIELSADVERRYRYDETGDVSACKISCALLTYRCKKLPYQDPGYRFRP